MSRLYPFCLFLSLSFLFISTRRARKSLGVASWESEEASWLSVGTGDKGSSVGFEPGSAVPRLGEGADPARIRGGPPCSGTESSHASCQGKKECRQAWHLSCRIRATHGENDHDALALSGQQLHERPHQLGLNVTLYPCDDWLRMLQFEPKQVTIKQSSEGEHQ